MGSTLTRLKNGIKKACKLLKISRSGYYDYLQRKKSKRTIENEALIEMIGVSQQVTEHMSGVLGGVFLTEGVAALIIIYRATRIIITPLPRYCCIVQSDQMQMGG